MTVERNANRAERTEREYGAPTLNERVRSPAYIGIACSATLLVALMAGNSRAEEGRFFGAHILQPKIEVAVTNDGALELTCTAGLIGGCCFPLTSHDVTAKLTVPPGVEVVAGPEPARYAVIEAPVSGTPKVWATFRWLLRRTSPARPPAHKAPS